jgi:hypothetical protein
MRDSLNRVHRVRDDLVRIAWVSACLVLVQRHGAHRNVQQRLSLHRKNISETRFCGSPRKEGISQNPFGNCRRQEKAGPATGVSNRWQRRPVGSTTTDTLVPGFRDLKIERPAFDCAAGGRPVGPLGL